MFIDIRLCVLDSTDWFIGSNILQNPEYPIIFDDIKGKHQNDKRGSSYNVPETDAAIKYLKKLLNWSRGGEKIHPRHIGIVSPYRGQCQVLEEACRQNKIVIGSSGVTIGTAEEFQGQERPIIIISTVRTNDDLGFTEDERVSSSHFFENSSLCN